MSKRHQSSRRRTYGRRQHELHERIDRRTDRGRQEPDRVDGEGWALSFVDASAARGRDLD